MNKEKIENKISKSLSKIQNNFCEKVDFDKMSEEEKEELLEQLRSEWKHIF